MNIGQQLIRELKRRRMLGSFFTFRGYGELRSVTTPEELSAFLERQGFPDVQTHGSVADIVDRLQARRNEAARRALLPELLQPAYSLIYHIF